MPERLEIPDAPAKATLIGYYTCQEKLLHMSVDFL
jgi:hypothetical protein